MLCFETARLNRWRCFLLALVLFAACVFHFPAEDARALNQSREYLRYDFATGQTTTYTLSALSELSLTRSVIGDDTRVPDTSNQAVVLAGGGAGFIVSDHIVATAAHCLYHRDIDNPANSHYITDARVTIYDESGKNSVKTLMPVSFHIPMLYFEKGENEFLNYDYGFIYVEEDLSEYGRFDLGVPMDECATYHTNVYNSGFPSDTDDGKFADREYKRYTGSGNVVEMTDYVVRYNADASGGNSGGPIYTESTFNNQVYRTVIAIHSAGDSERNQGVRVTTDLMHFYYNNPYAY